MKEVPSLQGPGEKLISGSVSPAEVLCSSGYIRTLSSDQSISDDTDDIKAA